MIAPAQPYAGTLFSGEWTLTITAGRPNGDTPQPHTLRAMLHKQVDHTATAPSVSKSILTRHAQQEWGKDHNKIAQIVRHITIDQGETSDVLTCFDRQAIADIAAAIARNRGDIRVEIDEQTKQRFPAAVESLLNACVTSSLNASPIQR